MGATPEAGGWQVSQVETLLDMPRRDITRSCYPDRKRGGAGILKPADSSWGRRSYSVEDMAWLYLVKLQHEAGYSLPEIARRMDTSVGAEELCRYLEAAAARAEERLEEVRIKQERARALRCAMGATSSLGADAGAQGVAEAMERHILARLGEPVVRGMRAALGMDAGGDVDAPELDSIVVDSLARALEEPGIDLAIELWAGPGAFARLLEAVAPRG